MEHRRDLIEAHQNDFQPAWRISGNDLRVIVSLATFTRRLRKHRRQNHFIVHTNNFNRDGFDQLPRLLEAVRVRGFLVVPIELVVH